MQSPLLSGCSAVRTPVLVIGQPLSFAAPPYLEFLLLDFPVCPSCLSKRLLTRFGYKLPPVDDLLFGRIVRFFHSFHSRQSLREVAFCFVSVHNGAFFGLRIPARAGSIVHRNKVFAKWRFALFLCTMEPARAGILNPKKARS